MINILTGRPGTGKTYSLVRIAYKAVKEGVNVYSNFKIDFSSLQTSCDKQFKGQIYFWDSIVDLIKIKQGIILIDEAQIYFNSRNWFRLPLRVQYKFQQHRKHGLDIYGAVQNVNRIDKIIRELVNNVFVLRKIGKLFVCYQYDIEDIDKAKRRSLKSNFYFLNKKLANCFDTFAEIQTDFD